MQCLHWHECAFHLEYFSYICTQGCSDLVRQQNRRVCLTTLNAHNGLPTNTSAERKLFLGHIAFEAQSADGISQNGGRHDNEEGKGKECTPEIQTVQRTKPRLFLSTEPEWAHSTEHS